MPFSWGALLYLFRRVEAEVGMASAQIGQLLNAEHLGLERRADRIQEITERPVHRSFWGRSPGAADSSQVGEVLLGRRRQLRGRSTHRPGVA